jgi:signal transduction histidine kinase
VTTSSGADGVGGLVGTYQSISAQANMNLNGTHFYVVNAGTVAHVTNLTTLVITDAAAGAALVVFGLWLVPRTIGVHTGLVKRNSELSSRVQKLTVTRVDAVDTAARELRRVERDLHDGAQARLVALGISLRVTENLIKTNPDAAVALVAEARLSSARALAELRDLVRGINPPVLVERGLGDAIRALALDAQVATTVDIELPGRPPAPVESAVYFAVAEALANAVKHADAGAVHIRVVHHRGMLRIEVSDNGAGGADPALGTGLLGMERRLGTFDGVLAVSSPPGGPTIVVIEVPCALSSPKIYSY